MKFDKKIQEVLREVSQPFQGYDAYTSRGMAGSANMSYGSPRRSSEEREVQRADRNWGLEKDVSSVPYYIVMGDERCKAWYKKNQPDSSMAKYGWKAFHLSKKYDAETTANEFAKKWNLKTPKYVAG